MNQENINAQIPDVFKLKIKLFMLVISSHRRDNESEQMLIIVVPIKAPPGLRTSEFRVPSKERKKERKRVASEFRGWHASSEGGIRGWHPSSE